MFDVPRWRCAVFQLGKKLLTPFWLSLSTEYSCKCPKSYKSGGTANPLVPENHHNIRLMGEIEVFESHRSGEVCSNSHHSIHVMRYKHFSPSQLGQTWLLHEINRSGSCGLPRGGTVSQRMAKLYKNGAFY